MDSPFHPDSTSPHNPDPAIAPLAGGDPHTEHRAIAAMPTAKSVTLETPSMPKSMLGADGNPANFQHGNWGSTSFELTPSTNSIPNYEILELLGKGGMGEVYRARDLQLSRLVAVKFLRDSNTDASRLARFTIEAESIAAIQHEHVVRVHHFGMVDANPYLVMEYLDGGSLADRIESDGKLSIPEATRIVREVADGLQACHDTGVIHRDLKPANILLDRQGHAKISDFGLAKPVFGQKLTASDAMVGTPAYMSPEQARGNVAGIGIAADIYATGVILYECLTGQTPFGVEVAWSTLERIIHDDPPPIRSLRPEVPMDLQLICQKCLAKSQAARYRSASELAEDLSRFANGDAVSVRPPTPIEQILRWTQRYPTPARVILTLLVAISLFSILAWNYSQDLKEANLRAETAQTKELAIREKEQFLQNTLQLQSIYRSLDSARLARTNPQPGWTASVKAALAESAALTRDPVLLERIRSEYLTAYLVRDLVEQTPAIALPKQTYDGHHLCCSPKQPWVAMSQFGFAEIGSPLKMKIWLHDLHTGQRLHTLFARVDPKLQKPNGYKQSPSGLQFSPDGEWLVMLDRSGRLHRWRMVEPISEEAITWQSSKTAGGTLQFSPDGTELWMTSMDGIEVWDTATWQSLRQASFGRNLDSIAFAPNERAIWLNWEGGCSNLDWDTLQHRSFLPNQSAGRFFSLPGFHVGYLSRGNLLSRIDLSSKVPLAEFEHSNNSGFYHSVAHPSGDLVAMTGHTMQETMLVDEHFFQPLLTIGCFRREVQPPVAFSPDGEWLVVGDRHEIRRFRSIQTRYPLAHQSAPIRRIGVSPSRTRLITRSEKHLSVYQNSSFFSIWDLQHPRRSPAWKQHAIVGEHFAPIQTWEPNLPDAQFHGTFGPDGFLWNPADGKYQAFHQPKAPLPISNHDIFSNGPGNRLWLGGVDPQILTRDGQLLPRRFQSQTLLESKGLELAKKLHGDRNGMLAADSLGGVAWLDADGAPRFRYPTVGSPVGSMRIRSSISQALIGTNHGVCRVIDLSNGTERMQWKASDSEITAMEWLSDSAVLIASKNRQLSLWTLDEPQPTRWFEVLMDAPVVDLFLLNHRHLAMQMRGAFITDGLDLDALLRDLNSVNLGIPVIVDSLEPPPASAPEPMPTPPAERIQGVRCDLFGHAFSPLDFGMRIGTIELAEPSQLSIPQHFPSLAMIPDFWSGSTAARFTAPDDVGRFFSEFRGWIVPPHANFEVEFHHDTDKEVRLEINGELKLFQPTGVENRSVKLSFPGAPVAVRILRSTIDPPKMCSFTWRDPLTQQPIPLWNHCYTTRRHADAAAAKQSAQGASQPAK
ncbi:serine/threonine-protein kinase [Tuwongella immobilis]|uniref:non-specific serine/threonine protein kinase n=1 Tax=Tuwongella immobilis TaxID=692036 RepID=A0A6C2YMS8_9BACT|nr:serine/threonine-protein kinase [Tuwongella immobilis]VIP02222.1 serine threonine protein kinase : Protein kinase family protein,GAF domain-containing protein OS=Singulisphaera acidiphila (strain ATCC BAA-1392 / DSM 18658 / VKM B-2454 / MOB10) GN=Sinac_4905 PE=4 SV=1: Pkinase [Tuwongella immobilis]VTS00753.1 serine threonine protein kinase : Protein kinase family protein,GAF domain-containing protein OS=Singulisphaera acidiphila (strain ATCC BAA-1392 / DSM 18658 / VKM B-2454 / MOB10) GN=Sinac_